MGIDKLDIKLLTYNIKCYLRQFINWKKIVLTKTNLAIGTILYIRPVNTLRNTLV